MLTVDRLFFDASATAIYGCSVFLSWIALGALGRSLATACRPSLMAASLSALLATLAWLPLEAATSGEDWGYAFDGHALLALLDTGIGNAWLVRLMLAFALIGVLHRRSAGVLQLITSALLLASLALSGHVRIDTGVCGALHGINDVVHLLSGGAWLGALLMLPLCLARLRDPLLGADARSALRRFSSAGHLAVALVVATGVVNTALILRRWPTDTGSTYQLLLAMKVGLVVAMIGLALTNRYLFVPQMRMQPKRTIIKIQVGTFAELALGLGVLALVATFGILDPT